MDELTNKEKSHLPTEENKNVAKGKISHPFL